VGHAPYTAGKMKRCGRGLALGDFDLGFVFDETMGALQRLVATAGPQSSPLVFPFDFRLPPLALEPLRRRSSQRKCLGKYSKCHANNQRQGDYLGSSQVSPELLHVNRGVKASAMAKQTP
jgi:hypothetical protein